MLATISCGGKTIKVFLLPQMELAHEFSRGIMSETSPIQSLSFTNDNGALLNSGDDGRFMVFRIDIQKVSKNDEKDKLGITI